METQKTRPMYEAYCKTLRETEKDEVFPVFFSFPPLKGDLVRSQSGAVYKIVSIMHTASITEGKYGTIQAPRAILGLERVSR